MNNRKKVFGWAAAAAAVLTLAACSIPAPSSGSETDPAAAPPAPSSGGETDPAAAPPAPSSGGDADTILSNLPADIEITFYQGDGFEVGEETTLSALLAQGKPVVLNFWAGLCPPCRIEMPDLQTVYDEYQDRVLLFGLDVGPFTGLGTRENGRELLQELGITFPAGTTFDSAVVQNFGVLGMPTTYFITPEGEVIRTWTGLLTADKMAELVDQLLDESRN